MRHTITVAALLIVLLLAGCTSKEQEVSTESPQTASPSNAVESFESTMITEPTEEIAPTSTESTINEPDFIQGKGYATGGYDKLAVQPTLTNWAGESRFNLADIESPLWNLKGKPDEFMNIVIGRDGVIYNAGKNITAINSDGSIKWVYEYVSSSGLVGQFNTPSISSDGTIYVSNGDRSLYAIKADGTLKWKTPTLSTSARESSPSISDKGTLYVTSSEGLHAINSKDGSVKWSFVMAESVGSPAIAKDGTIYIGGRKKTDTSVRLYAITPEGTEKWNRPIKVITSPTIAADGTIYVIKSDPGSSSELVAVSPDGQQKIIYRIPNLQDEATNIAISKDNVLYFGTRAGYIYAVRENGELLWEYVHKPGRDVSFTEPVIDSEGTLLIGINDAYNFSMIKSFDESGKDKSIVSFTEPPYYKIHHTGIIGSDGSLYFVIRNGHESFLYAGGGKQKITTAKTDVAEANDDLSQFEGKWSTPGSDELAFNLSFIDDENGRITFFQEGEESPLPFKYYSEEYYVLLYAGENEDIVIKIHFKEDGNIIFESNDQMINMERF